MTIQKETFKYLGVTAVMLALTWAACIVLSKWVDSQARAPVPKPMVKAKGK